MAGLAALLAVMAAAVAQSVSGIGFALVCGPLLVAALGPHEAVRLVLLLSCAVNLVVLARSSRRVMLRDLLLLAGPAVLLTPLVVRLLQPVPERASAAVAGGTALLGAGVLATGVRPRGGDTPAAAVLAGLVSAVTNVAAGIGGPPIALWATAAGRPADTLRSTVQVVFLLLNVVALASLGLPSLTAPRLLACVAALAVGLAAGGPVARRTGEVTARRATLALAGAGGFVVLARAAVGG